MAGKKHTYESDDIIVTYAVQRCIHAAECVGGLRSVFDPERRPWVDPERASADRIANVVARCPTGALHAERKDGGAEETVPAENTVRINPDGPLYLRGDVAVTLPDGAVLQDTRVALCRCGASKNKPFCDNSHRKIPFRDAAHFKTVQVKPSQDGAAGSLRVKPSKNGPYLLQGPLKLIGADDVVEGGQAVLCRCGGSSNKPFCDGTHNRNGFSA